MESVNGLPKLAGPRPKAPRLSRQALAKAKRRQDRIDELEMDKAQALNRRM